MNIVCLKSMEIGMINKLKRKDYWINKVVPNHSEINVELFLIFFTGETDRPLVVNNRVCFFSREVFLEMLNNIGISISSKKLDIEIDYLVDMNKVLKLISFNSLDRDATLVISINTLLDMFYPLNIKLPNEYKHVLYSFANHLSFNKRYGSFFKENDISRIDLVNAITWLSGTILLNSSYNERSVLETTFNIHNYH